MIKIIIGLDPFELMISLCALCVAAWVGFGERSWTIFSQYWFAIVAMMWVIVFLAAVLANHLVFSKKDRLPLLTCAIQPFTAFYFVTENPRDLRKKKG